MLGSGIQERKIGHYDVTVDGTHATIAASVTNLDEDDDNLVYRNPADFLGRGNVLPSVSLIRSGKVKGFIDSVYAAVEEHVMEEGHPLSRPDFLKELLKKDKYIDAQQYLTRALDVVKYSTMMSAKEDINLVHGFYNRTLALQGAFRQIKVLQNPPTKFEKKESKEIDRFVIEELDQTIEDNCGLRKRYDAIQRLYAKMTNQSASADALFPAAVLPDMNYLVKLSQKMQSDLPEGLAKSVVRAMQDGVLDYTPDEKSGLYIWQMHEVQAMAKRDTPEFKKFLLDKKYQKVLDEEAEGQFVMTRDTHVAHYDYGTRLIGCSMSCAPPRVVIRPELQTEPLVEVYDRMRKSLRFLQETVRSEIGEEFLDKGRILHTGKRSDKRMVEEFAELDVILSGLSVLSKESIHMQYKPKDDVEEVFMRGSAEYAEKWLKNIKEDVDVARDMATFVPLMKTTDGSKWIAHAVGGFELTPVKVDYDIRPSVKVIDSYTGITFDDREYRLPTLVHKEVRIPVGFLINTKQFGEELPVKSFTRDDFNKTVRKIECKE